MNKAHITIIIGTCPAFMTYTDGVVGDSPELQHHLDALSNMDAKINEFR